MYGRQAAEHCNDDYDDAQANDQSTSDILAYAHRGHIYASKTNSLLVKFKMFFISLIAQTHRKKMPKPTSTRPNTCSRRRTGATID